MRIWLPYVRAGSGIDVFTEHLAAGLAWAGHDAILDPLPKSCQYAPWTISKRSAPPNTDIVVAASWIAFACKRPGTSLITIFHHCVHDPVHQAARSAVQALFHRTAVRRFDRASLRAADAVVAVSAYTARSVARSIGVSEPRVILNGIDTTFFTPGSRRTDRGDGPFQLLFVGNPTLRKGGDLLAPILEYLGAGYMLRYTTGLRNRAGPVSGPGIQCLGRLDKAALRQAYRDADVLLFPSRLEGFGYAAAEAMACGTPVIASDCSALPEIVVHGRTGLLCPVGDVPAFATAIAELAANPRKLAKMRQRARRFAEERLELRRMAAQYIDLFEMLFDGAATQQYAHAT